MAYILICNHAHNYANAEIKQSEGTEKYTTDSITLSCHSTLKIRKKYNTVKKDWHQIRRVESRCVYDEMKEMNDPKMEVK